MPRNQVVVRSNRLRLMIQGIALFSVLGGGGYLLQRWDVISGSALGRLDALMPGPLLLFVGLALGAWIALTIVRDSWHHEIVIGTEGLSLRTGRGVVQIPYAEIAEVKQLPWYGAGIRLKNFKTWLDGQYDAPTTLGQEAGVLRGRYDVDIGILSKNLDVGVDRFIGMVRDHSTL